MTHEPYVPQKLFFLGAGFSSLAGLPLASELLTLTLRELEQFQPETHVHWALDEYLDYVEAVTGKPRLMADQVDIEDFITYLDHEHFFGMRGSDTFSSAGNQAQLLLRWGIGRVLHRATPGTLPDLYMRFAEKLRPQDIVATFNYDLVLEQALASIGKPYRRFPARYEEVRGTTAYGSPEIDRTEVVIVKLHGSLDWVDRSRFEERLRYMHEAMGDEGTAFVRRRDPIFGDQPIVTAGPLVDGPRFADDPLSNVAIIDDVATYYSTYSMWYEHPPLLLAPSDAKQLYGSPFRGLWEGLPLGASLWGAFSIVGCSLPPADPYARQVLYRVGRDYGYGREHPEERFGPMNRIKVVNRAADDAQAARIRETYRFLPAEHTDFLLDGLDTNAVEELFEAGE
jgi:SIR2-like domain